MSKPAFSDSIAKLNRNISSANTLATHGIQKSNINQSSHLRLRNLMPSMNAQQLMSMEKSHSSFKVANIMVGS
jgi:hypothetical protein